MITGRLGVCLSAWLGVFASAGTSAQWPQFRGPNGSGVAPPASYPSAFSGSTNVVWKAAVPYGQSSPVVAGDRVYLTASEGDRLLTLAFDRATGREAWRRDIRRGRSATIFRANDPASPTPAADDRGVIVFFADAGIIAYSRDGDVSWRLPLGPFRNFYGMAASPILAGDMVVLVCDQQAGSFVVALDRATGRERWKTPRPAATVGWATPAVFEPPSGPGGSQLIVLGSTRLDSYSLRTGEPRWWMPLASMGGVGTPVTSGDLLLVSSLNSSEPWMPTFESVLAQYDRNKDGRLSQQEFSGDKDLGEHFGWIDADSDGFVTPQEWNTGRQVGIGEYGAVAIRPETLRGRLDPASVVWRFKKNLPFVPAPLAYGGVLYLVKTGGIVTALDAATGRTLKEGRTREALGEYYASPIAADGKVFLASEEGKITVLKAGGEWEVLAVNDLGEEIHATPALSGGRIFVRTRGSLYCFGSAVGRGSHPAMPADEPAAL